MLLYILAGYFLYSPPLLESRGYNLPGRVYDFLAYVYHITSATWRESSADPGPALRSAVRAAWHRPSRIRELLGVDPDDLPALAEAYASLGLTKEAVRLFRKASHNLPGGEGKAREIISCLAALGDWEGAAAAARRQLAAQPDCAEIEYWLGRGLLETGLTERAAGHLQRAVQLRPDLADARFRLGSIAEARDDMASARDLYEQTIAGAPGHLEAREGLARIYRGQGEEEKAKAARTMAAELVAPVAVNRKLGNFAVLGGFNPPAPRIASGGELGLELYLEGWQPERTEVALDLSFSSDASPEELILPAGTVVLQGPGEVAKFRAEQVLPRILYPGEVSLGVVFRKEETVRAVPLVRFRLFPAWRESSGIDLPLAEKFGRGASSLGKAAFLGPGDELELSLDPPLPASALVLVSYLHCGMSLLQGAEAGEVTVRTEAGDEFSYPLRAGREVSEVWWESVAPGRRKHGRAPVFRSWPAESGGKKFSAGEYYAVFPFARPLRVKSLRLRNSTGRSGWHVTGMALLPPAEGVSGVSSP